MKRGLLLLVLALAMRILAATWIGPGPFGPDAAGAEAATVLGGHPYPLHPLLILLSGSGRLLSLVAGALVVLACAAMGERIGCGWWSSGILAASAPLLLYPSTLGGGDTAALALATVGIALAWSARCFSGGLLATCALGVKPIALPVLPLLLLAPFFGDQRGRQSLRLLAGCLLALLAFHPSLAPLWSPRPDGGILGSWWLASGGMPPRLSEWPGLLGHGLSVLTALPTWTGHPVLGGLALLGALLPGPQRHLRIGLFVLAMGSMWLTASLLGDRLHPRYLGPASVALVVLAGRSLSRFPATGVLALWPSLALCSQLGIFRSLEEATEAPPDLPWLGAIDLEDLYRDASICGAPELRSIASRLAESLPPGAEVVALRLRDGREGEVLWPLLTKRPDLRATVLEGRCCVEEAGHCAYQVIRHVKQGGALVAPLRVEGCLTEVLDPGEQALGTALSAHLDGENRHGFLIATGPGASEDACQAAATPTAPPR